MGIACLLLSFSVICLLFRDPQRERRLSRTVIFILALAVIWAAWLGLDAVIGRFTTLPGDFLFRGRIWENTLRIIQDFPLLGTGLGTFVQIFPLYQSFSIQGVVTHAENDYLQLASDMGVVGLIILLVAFVMMLVAVFSKVRSLSGSIPHRNIFVGGMVGILALMVFSLFERNIQVSANSLIYIFILCLILRDEIEPAKNHKYHGRVKN
jgi:O-antigen ligase